MTVIRSQVIQVDKVLINYINTRIAELGVAVGDFSEVQCVSSYCIKLLLFNHVGTGKC